MKHIIVVGPTCFSIKFQRHIITGKSTGFTLFYLRLATLLKLALHKLVLYSKITKDKRKFRDYHKIETKTNTTTD